MGGGKERRLQVSFTVLYFQAGHENQIIYILYDNFKCLSILDKKFWFEALV